MAIQLSIYLKRTDQTIQQWMQANDIHKAADLLPRCAYLGLAAGPADVAQVAQVLKEMEAPVPAPKAPKVEVAPEAPSEPAVERKPKRKKADEAPGVE